MIHLHPNTTHLVTTGKPVLLRGRFYGAIRQVNAGVSLQSTAEQDVYTYDEGGVTVIVSGPEAYEFEERERLTKRPALSVRAFETANLETQVAGFRSVFTDWIDGVRQCAMRDTENAVREWAAQAGITPEEWLRTYEPTLTLDNSDGMRIRYIIAPRLREGAAL